MLVDGLAGRVVARVDAESPGHSSRVQGVGGAFWSTNSGFGTLDSTAKLQLGTAQAVGVLFEPDPKFGVGSSGLTVV